MDLSLIHYPQFDFSSNEDKKARVKSLFSELNHLRTYTDDLLTALKGLAIPLRFSILALLSDRKVSPFDESLMHLVHDLIEKGFSSDNHAKLLYEDDEYFWRSEKPTSRFKLHQIAIELLSTKPGLLDVEKPLQ